MSPTTEQLSKSTPVHEVCLRTITQTRLFFSFTCLDAKLIARLRAPWLEKTKLPQKIQIEALSAFQSCNERMNGQKYSKPAQNSLNVKHKHPRRRHVIPSDVAQHVDRIIVTICWCAWGSGVAVAGCVRCCLLPAWQVHQMQVQMRTPRPLVALEHLTYNLER